MKLQQYGETNEHRPLYLAFLSSAENMSNLEAIRLNNLRLANLAADKGHHRKYTGPRLAESYNVHGNENLPPKRRCFTLFALAIPANTRTKRMAENTVVIIDPASIPWP